MQIVDLMAQREASDKPVSLPKVPTIQNTDSRDWGKDLYWATGNVPDEATRKAAYVTDMVDFVYGSSANFRRKQSTFDKLAETITARGANYAVSTLTEIADALKQDPVVPFKVSQEFVKPTLDPSSVQSAGLFLQSLLQGIGGGGSSQEEALAQGSQKLYEDWLKDHPEIKSMNDLVTQTLQSLNLQVVPKGTLMHEAVVGSRRVGFYSDGNGASYVKVIGAFSRPVIK